MSNRNRRKMSTSQRLFWILSVFLVASMVISLVIVAFPGAPAPTSTPVPTLEPTATWAPFPSSTPSPTVPPPSPTTANTEPLLGPVGATTAPVMPATSQPIGPLPPTVTPTGTATPAAASLESAFAACGDSRGDPGVARSLLEAIRSAGSCFLSHAGDLVGNQS